MYQNINFVKILPNLLILFEREIHCGTTKFIQSYKLIKLFLHDITDWKNNFHLNKPLSLSSTQVYKSRPSSHANSISRIVVLKHLSTNVLHSQYCSKGLYFNRLFSQSTTLRTTM